MRNLRLIPLLCTLALAQQQTPKPSPDGATPSSPLSQAEIATRAARGMGYLAVGNLDLAEQECNAVYRLDSSNAVAMDCLGRVASMQRDKTLNDADGSLAAGDTANAIKLASPLVNSGTASPAQRQRAQAILSAAKGPVYGPLLNTITGEPILGLAAALVLIVCGIAALYLLRFVWRGWRAFNSATFAQKTMWSVLPVKENADLKLGATEVILDALGRLPREVDRKLWEPDLLLLKPTPPADYEPELISGFLKSTGPIVLAPPAKDLDLRCELHDIQLDEAVQGLQLKVQGVDLGSVARFVRTIWHWLNTGAPTLTGCAELTAEKNVAIHLSAAGGPGGFVTVLSTTPSSEATDAVRLSAERAAFKLLYRLRYPERTQAEVDGQAALRQAATLFTQYAGTAAGAASDTKARVSGLRTAAYNFGFARASMPATVDSLADPRPAILLAEGTAYALVGDNDEAIERFQQLEDWPCPGKLNALRAQGLYNDAVVMRRMGKPAAAVLLLTNLLRERSPDLEDPDEERDLDSDDTYCAVVARDGHGNAETDLPEGLRLAARLARVAATSAYDDESWARLPEQRAVMLIEDSKNLICDVEALRASLENQPRDRRIAEYIHTEALRARGRLLLRWYSCTLGAALYVNGRPLKLKRVDSGQRLIPEVAPSRELVRRMEEAATAMKMCEDQVGGNVELYCDLAEAYLLMAKYKAAEGYARQATLLDNSCERAFYLVSEICYLCATAATMERARSYASAYKGMTTTKTFAGLKADLGLAPASVAAKAGG